MSLSHESCDCRRREPPPEGAHDDDWFPKCEGILERPGDFLWLRNAAGEITDILIFLPGNEGGSIAPVPVVRGPHDAGRWGWDGNEDLPSLVPSIWRNPPHPREDDPIGAHRNEWHGNLTAGRLVSG